MFLEPAITIEPWMNSGSRDSSNQDGNLKHFGRLFLFFFPDSVAGQSLAC